MAKSTCLLALFLAVVSCAIAIRIDTARNGGGEPRVHKNDPRCNGKTGMIAVPEDCTKFIKCFKGGESVERKCPGKLMFDSRRFCVRPDQHPDCGKKTLSAPLNVDEKCPKPDGMFPVKSDCHKYMICVAGDQKIINCHPGQVYREINGGCVKGDVCPKQSSEETVCKEANQLLPDEEDNQSYIKCVNFRPIKKKCPSGTTFHPRKLKCTKE